MKKVLVVYATKSGCTQSIAERVGAVMAQSGARVDVLSPDKAVDPSGYDYILVGSGIRIAQWHRSAVEWLTTHAEILRSKPLAIFSVCLTLVKHPEQAEEVRSWIHPLVAELGIEPLNHGVFLGWGMPEKFSLLESTLMWAHGDRCGDFRDWAAINEWSHLVAREMALMGPTCEIADGPGHH